MKFPLVVGMTLFASVLFACIWDSDTLHDEVEKNPKLAEIVLGGTGKRVDTDGLRDRIQRLEASPEKDDAKWWNDLAGAHIRLGEPQKAVQLLQPLLTRFPDDYGIHANLGTAYHLLGNYAEAEKHIARDLELNPEAHFGLEKYHLALLQYLIRDLEYQKSHVYVYEWTLSFFDDAPEMQRPPAAFEHNVGVTNDNSSVPPNYIKQFDLASDAKLEEGVTYMAILNPKEPACFVMLGVLCCHKRDFNLAVAAYRKAVDLGSHQKEVLEQKIAALEDYIKQSQNHGFKARQLRNVGANAANAIVVLIVLSIGFVVWLILRKKRT